TDYFNAVGAPMQDVLRCVRAKPPDEANDLARSDIERGDNRRAFRRQRLRLGGEAELKDVAHALPSFFGDGFFSFWASARACAAAGDSRTVTRSPTRRSMAEISREVSFSSRSSAASRANARTISSSGGCTSSPLRRLRFQRRSSTRTDART